MGSRGYGCETIINLSVGWEWRLKIETTTIKQCAHRCGLTTREGQFLKAHLRLLKNRVPHAPVMSSCKRCFKALWAGSAVVIRRFDSTMAGRPVLGNCMATTNSAPGSTPWNLSFVQPKLFTTGQGSGSQYIRRWGKRFALLMLRMSGNTMYFQCDETVEDVNSAAFSTEWGGAVPAYDSHVAPFVFGWDVPCASAPFADGSASKEGVWRAACVICDGPLRTLQRCKHR